MNHVGVALDGHQFVDFDAADRRDAADVVSTEIDQHDVFGPFLRVGKQIGFELAFFFRRGAAPARAGDRAELDGVAGEPHHGFRRRADDPQIFQLQVKHVGRWIDKSQRAIDFKRIGRRSRFRAVGRARPE